MVIMHVDSSVGLVETGKSQHSIIIWHYAGVPSRLSQSPNSRTTIPEANVYVGDARSTQVDRLVSTSGSSSSQAALSNTTFPESTNLSAKLFNSWNFC